MSRKVKATTFLDRRGASDFDRPAWLLERMNGVTATEVSKLAAYKTAAGRNKAMGTLADEKVNDSNTFKGNRYTDWGSAREPALEEWAEFAFGFIPESRIAYAEHDRQHLASIDGWKVDADGTLHLAELKTSGKPLTYALLTEKGYVDQTLWQMHVTGGVDALVFWEHRVEVGGEFVPGVRGTIMVERDEARIAKLIEYATAFLLVLMDRLVGHDGSMDDPMLDDIVTRLQGAKALVKELDPKVREMMESSGMTSAKTAKWNVSYEAAEPNQIADLAGFKKALPDQAAELETIATEREEYRLDELEQIEKERAEYRLDELDKIIAERADYRLSELGQITAMQAKYTKAGEVGNPTLRITIRKDAK